MSKAEKLAAKILGGKSDQNFSFVDLCHVIERAASNGVREKEATEFITKIESSKSSMSSRAAAARPNRIK